MLINNHAVTILSCMNHFSLYCLITACCETLSVTSYELQPPSSYGVVASEK